jgi:flagellar hook-associated protein 2
MDLGISGLASGFDWKTFISQMADAERAPETRLRTEQTTLQKQNAAYTSLKTELGVLQDKINALKDASLFASRLATTGDTSLASATVSNGAAQGTYAFNFIQLATGARQLGASGTGAPLSATNDVSGLVLSSASFSTAVTAGTFTVNGKQVTIATTDTLQDVFDKISTATGGTVTGSYDSATDKISLSSASAIVLGSATDTSNFLMAARLNNNGTGTVTSANELGSIKLTASLSSANLATAINDGGAGAGEFKINGVSISYAATDSVNAVLKRINDSSAGVSASYDAVNDRFVLANKGTGDIGIALEDVTGNFLAATGLSTGAISRGQDLIYTVDNGPQLISHSNTITESSSGLTGLSVTALQEGTTTVNVTSDTATMKQAIQDFLTEYNKVQSMIDTQTASSTDANGKVTAGLLANDSFAGDLATTLRRTVNNQVSGLNDALNQLEDMGISGNGSDNSLTLSDETKLDAALANNLSAVSSLFTDSTNGLATKLSDYLDKTIGDTGTMVTKQDNLTKASTSIDTQIADLERIVQANSDRLTESFIAMEEAQAKINQQLTFLQQRFGTSSSSSSSS